MTAWESLWLHCASRLPAHPAGRSRFRTGHIARSRFSVTSWRKSSAWCFWSRLQWQCETDSDGRGSLQERLGLLGFFLLLFSLLFAQLLCEKGVTYQSKWDPECFQKQGLSLFKPLQEPPWQLLGCLHSVTSLSSSFLETVGLKRKLWDHAQAPSLGRLL